MKILYNIDGSISKLILGKFVQQNNNNVDKISVAINGKLPEQYQVNAVFTLPDGTVNEILASQTETIEFGSFHIDGYYFYLTNAQTLYSGVLKMSLQIIDILDSRKVLWTYQTEFTINPTGVLPDEVLITQAEYNAIVEAIGSSITPEVQWGQILGSLANQADLAAALNAKQVKLVAGENIMTINGQSILQGGNLDVGILTQAQLDATNSGITQAKREGYDAAVVSLENHESNTTIHVTSGDKNTWNQAVTLLTSHVNNETIHVTGNEKATWNAHVINTGIHVTPTQKTNWDNHIADSNIHVTLTEKTGWDNKSVVVARATGTSTNYISFITIDGIEYQINPLVSGSVNWGNITGSLSAQTDLKAKFDEIDTTINASCKLYKHVYSFTDLEINFAVQASSNCSMKVEVITSSPTALISSVSSANLIELTKYSAKIIEMYGGDISSLGEQSGSIEKGSLIGVTGIVHYSANYNVTSKLWSCAGNTGTLDSVVITQI